MSAVPLRKLNGKTSAARVVSVLGATGSIGDSTMDLLRRARDRYRVEALTAHSNVQALAKLAREFDIRFAAGGGGSRPVGIPGVLAGTCHDSRPGRGAPYQAA